MRFVGSQREWIGKEGEVAAHSIWLNIRFADEMEVDRIRGEVLSL
jgi:hypothetical protein